MAIKRAYCHYCQSEGPATVRSMPHIAHLLLTFVTCGFWSIIWALCYRLKIGEKANCNRCGTAIALLLCLACYCHGQERPHPRVDRVLDRIGEQIIFRLKSSDPVETNKRGKILAYSVENVTTTGGQVVPRWVTLLEPQPDGISREVTRANPFYVGKVATLDVSLDLRYFRGENLAGRFMVPGVYQTEPDGSVSLGEVKADVRKRLATGTLWDGSTAFGGNVITDNATGLGTTVIDTNKATPTVEALAAVDAVVLDVLLEQDEVFKVLGTIYVRK